jgi:hypothetical protein
VNPNTLSNGHVQALSKQMLQAEKNMYTLNQEEQSLLMVEEARWVFHRQSEHGGKEKNPHLC